MPSVICYSIVMLLCRFYVFVKFINPFYRVGNLARSHYRFLPNFIINRLFKKTLFPHTPYTLIINYISIFIFIFHMGLHMGVHMGRFFFCLFKVFMPTFYEFFAFFGFRFHAFVAIKTVIF